VDGRKRALICNIDGDGSGVTEWVDAVLELIERHPVVKFDVGAITAYLDGTLRAKQTSLRRELFRKLYGLENVEVASHSHSHPTKWKSFDSAHYLPGPWSYKKQVQYSANVIDDELCPANKQTRIFLLTGDCKPRLGAIRAIQARGLIPFNGVVGRNWNGIDGGIGYIPYDEYRKPGGMRRWLQQAPHDLMYTRYTREIRGEHGHPLGYEAKYPDAYHGVLDWFKVHRWLPVHVYFHFYCAASAETYAAVGDVLDWVSERDLQPMFLSEYAAAVEAELRK